MRLALAVTTSVLVACGAGNSDGSGAASPFSASSSSSSGDAPAQPFLVIQPEDARLAMAAQALKAGIGHEVQVDVDSALLKDHASTLQNELSDALETISRGLEQARTERPDIVLRNTAILGKLRFELDEKAREHFAVLTDTGELIIHVPTQATYFTTDAVIANVILAK